MTSPVALSPSASPPSWLGFKTDHSYPKGKIKVLLLETINPRAKQLFEAEGFQVESVAGTLPIEELKARISDVHAVGIRSRTNLTREILEAGKKLLVVGCFCIGTNQVELESAKELGVPVFNSPFCNSRSVAELIIAEIISLSRQLGDRNREMHTGAWKKSDKGCREVRGKILGIVGYGHIGSQLSVLAEGLGLRVIFYDVVNVMALGNSRACRSLSELLGKADFVTLHVPLTPETTNMIAAKEIAMMKRGSYLLNASRGTVVDLEALASALKSGHLAGAALDVYPSEPSANISNDFKSVMQNCPNTILTPHIGGSTEEAQVAIADEVSTNMIAFINSGRTMGAVNFPIIDQHFSLDTHRILNIHKNIPGTLRNINNILADYNIVSQSLDTSGPIGYLVVDVDKEASHEVKKKIAELPTSIKTRILY